VNLAKSLVCLSVALGCTIAFTVPASAHTAFKKKLAEKYPNKKISCTACHIPKAEIDPDETDPKDKKPRNNYGKLIQSQFESKTLSAERALKKGQERKDFENDVMVPEFEKAFEKVKAMTVHDLIEAGFFEGIDVPKEENGN
jgi:hypothetical protein